MTNKKVVFLKFWFVLEREREREREREPAPPELGGLRPVFKNKGDDW